MTVAILKRSEMSGSSGNKLLETSLFNQSLLEKLTTDITSHQKTIQSMLVHSTLQHAAQSVTHALEMISKLWSSVHLKLTKSHSLSDKKLDELLNILDELKSATSLVLLHFNTANRDALAIAASSLNNAHRRWTKTIDS
jgi:hypothetical protein